MQFGAWNFDGKLVDTNLVDRARTMLEPYGPDSEGLYRQEGVVILSRAFHTTPESRAERQPYIAASGSVISWDGRLDNRIELIDGLQLAARPSDLTDVAIVAAAYEKWGADCMARLVGEWVLSIWNPRDESVILGKDHTGTRQLFYAHDAKELRWSTLLDPLVYLSPTSLHIDLEYIAGWLTLGPSASHSPYEQIRSVPPCHHVTIRRAQAIVSEYWNFDPAKKIRYRSDAEYEEHYRTVFFKAVERRLRSDRPILADLSGGMDSTSIVCAADRLRQTGNSNCPRVDTISYYSDTEPNWDERPYFSLVEEQRGRQGWHINVSSVHMYDFTAAAPFSVCGPANSSSSSVSQFVSIFRENGFRVELCGSGGDEVTGGVPSPVPELADLASRLQFRRLAFQLKAWALVKRKPWFQLVADTAREFLPSGGREALFKHVSAWLNPDFVRAHRRALSGYESRLRVFGGLPSFQANLATLDVMRRQLSWTSASLEIPYERRYPYLDRDLLEFLYAIPREQMVRPGQRRSLMRRALKGIVPGPILDRRRKAFVSHAPFNTLATRWNDLMAMTKDMRAELLGIIDMPQFVKAAREGYENRDVPVVPILRMCLLEKWLRQVAELKTCSAESARKMATTTTKQAELQVVGL